MIVITSHTNFIEIDFGYYVDQGEPFFERCVFIMKDKLLYAGIVADLSSVSLNMVDGTNFFFDMDGNNGFPVKIDNVTPEDNEALVLALAQLR